MTIKVETKNSGISNYSALKRKLDKIKEIGLPCFVTHNPDISGMKKMCGPLKKYKNILIIGNGGSVNSSSAIYELVGRLEKRKKKIIFLTTMEPDFINRLKKEYHKKDTLVLPISKSGTNVGPLESMLSFLNSGYSIAIMTNKNNGALLEIAEKRKLPLIEHPEVGGRFSGRTSCAMVPAELIGVDINKLNKGFLKIYRECAPNISIEKNPALKLAATLYILEQHGNVDVFIPAYSTQLYGVLPLIIQLMHESFGKEGRGQSYFGGLSPETQHHTNQRFFGGRRNIAGLFLTAENQFDKKTKVAVPKDLKDITLRNGVINDISGVPYEKSLEFEYLGTYDDAISKRIPVCRVSVDKITDFTAGEILGFWQYVAVYSSLLRDVNPYDQPQVEASKEISFKMRMEYNKKTKARAKK